MSEDHESRCGADGAQTDSRQFGFDNRIAPRETGPATTHFLEEMLRGAYDHGTVLRYHDYDLCHLGENENVWRVEHADPEHDTADPLIDVVNVGSIQSLGVLEAYLSALVEHGPRTRAEWRKIDQPISRESRPHRTG